MFSLLAIIVTVLVLDSAMLWRTIRALSCPGVRSRTVSRASLQTVESAGAPVASTSSSRRR